MFFFTGYFEDVEISVPKSLQATKESQIKVFQRQNF